MGMLQSAGLLVAPLACLKRANAADFNKLGETADDGTESVHQEAQGEKTKYFCT